MTIFSLLVLFLLAVVLGALIGAPFVVIVLVGIALAVVVPLVGR